MSTIRFILFYSLIILPCLTKSQITAGYRAVYSGVPWQDAKGNTVSAHGACIVKDNDFYYLFGEYKTDSANVFNGFSCYSSKDLYNWQFERIALPVQQHGKLGPNRVGERPKVMKSPTTGEYVMYMHVDSLNYKDQFVGYATAKDITGPYVFQGPLLYNGNPIKKWDMGTFQDEDCSGYILIHGGEIYKLDDDYKSVQKKVNESMGSGFESPTMLKKGNTYYFLGSHLTSWERNDNYYFTAPSINGPWTERGLFAPEGTLTWNSQCTFVLPVTGSRDTTYMYMGDRWSFPKQNSAATYVWQPLTIDGEDLSIPLFQEAWTVDLATGEHQSLQTKQIAIANTDKKVLSYRGSWREDTLMMKSSDNKGDSFSVRFKGTGIELYAFARPDGGYAKVSLKNKKGEMIAEAIVDMYCLYPTSTLKFASPRLKEDTYTLTVTVMGERGNWSDKRKSNYGSTGYFVSLDKFNIIL